MLYLKSVLFLFILLNVSDNVIAQDEKQNPITIIENDKNKLQIAKPKINSTYPSNYNSHLNLLLRNQINDSSNNHFKAPNAGLRFDLNYVKVDPFIFTGTSNNNFRLIQRGYEPHYQNPNNQRTFTGELILGILESCFIKL